MKKTCDIPVWRDKTVVGMGLTSFLSDACHETSTTVLPAFLALIGAPPAALGLIEGVSDAVSSFVKLGGGWIADRFGHRKAIITCGYLLTGISQAVFAFALTWHLVMAGRVVGWFARGFRGPVRDAMLADAIAPENRGKAFGFHRAGDTVGGIIGPLLAVWLLSFLPQFLGPDPSRPFRVIFLLTLIPGVLSAVAFAWLIVEKRHGVNPHVKLLGTLRNLPSAFKRYLAAVGLFGMGDFAPALLILAATQLLQADFGIVKAAQLAALMYVFRNVVYAAASYPVGALSDRLGRLPSLVFGYGLAALTMLGFLLAFLLQWHHPGYLFFLFGLAGVFIAAEDTLESAATADFIPSATRGIGMGALGAVNGIGDFVASAVVGGLWTLFSPVAAFGFSCLMMLGGTALLARTIISDQARGEALS